MAVPEQQREAADLLGRLSGAAPIETHISAVFVGADTVWKLKKAVRLTFLDFARVDDRRRFLEREIELNAPHAPGLYRDVVPIVRGADGALALGGDGVAVDWVLRMDRVPAADFLDAVARAGGLTPALLDAAADRVAACHAALPPLPGVRSDMAWVARSNADAALAAGLDPARIGAWRASMLERLDALADWRDARAREGFVRRCHGDLHLGNMCLRGGVPIPFDALEFDEALATTDTGYDLAFLLMDLDVRAGRAAANRAMNRYLARTGDWGMLAGMAPFLSSRALIRAHVASRPGTEAAAEDYLRRAEAYLAPAPGVVVAIGGLPGTGKSTLARALAPGLGAAPGAAIARSDEIRKRLAGLAPEERLPPDAYTPQAGRAVFARLAEEIALAARAGQSAIADAMFAAPEQRAAVEAAARGADVPFVGIWLEAPLAELERRVAARRGDASDAGVEVLRAAARNDAGPGGWTPVDAASSDAAAALAMALIRPHIH